jgi:hypothetical protein
LSIFVLSQGIRRFLGGLEELDLGVFRGFEVRINGGARSTTGDDHIVHTPVLAVTM